MYPCRIYGVGDYRNHLAIRQGGGKYENDGDIDHDSFAGCILVGPEVEAGHRA